MRRFFLRLQVLVLGWVWALAMPAVSFAQATNIFPVSSDLATIKSDLLLWGTALIGIALAVYAFRRVRGLVNR